jgi:PAS domain-containing protein
MWLAFSQVIDSTSRLDENHALSQSQGLMGIDKKAENKALENRHNLVEALSESARLVASFSNASAIELALYDSQVRFMAVNNAASATGGIPPEAFVGKTSRDIFGDAASGQEARLRRVWVAGETPSMKVTAMLPQRSERGYWIQKIFPIRGRSGNVTQLAALSVEVTAYKKLENCFHKLGSQSLWENTAYKRLAGEFHHSINKYHVALALSLDALSRSAGHPERIPELLAQSMEFLDEHMRKLACAVARCLPTDQQH